MSHCVSNLSISRPLSAPSQRTTAPLNPSFSRFPHLRTPTARTNSNKSIIKAVAPNGGERLQRATKPQSQQPQRRVAQVPPTGLWDRFPTARTVQQMMDTMDRVMEDPLAYSGAWVAPLPSESGGYSRGRAPWEIKEGENAYKMRFDMPGMTKDDVKIWVEEKMLVLKAEKVSKRNNNKSENENENGKEGVHLEEEEWPARSFGKYSCRIALPENVEFEKIKAEVKDGVLYVTIPKAKSTAKVFDINVN